MKQRMRLVAVAGLLIMCFIACKKQDNYTTDVLLMNASWSAPAITGTWAGISFSSSPLAQGQSSGTTLSPYVQVPAGISMVTLKSGANVIADKNLVGNNTGGTTLLLYDTSATIVSPLQVLELSDTLTRPDTAQLKIRFINASPDTSGNADLWLVNPGVDSLLLGTENYIGNDAEAATVQPFPVIITYHGEPYTIKIKQAGTTTELVTIPNYYFEERGVYSFVFSGLSNGNGGAAFKITVLHHFVK